MEDSTINKEILFMNIDETEKICNECRKKRIQNCRLWNRNETLQKISQKVKIFLITENHSKNVTYKNYSCALVHYDKECMKNCIYKKNKLEKPLDSYCLWAYYDYPNK